MSFRRFTGGDAAMLLADHQVGTMGWRQSSSMHTEFVLDALEQALYDRKPSQDDGLVHHSDRGSQGGFSRSSQHRVVRRIVDARSMPRPESASPASCVAGC